VKPVVIGTRGSPLALAQSRAVQNQLIASHPGLSIELKIIRTRGDAWGQETGTPPPPGKGLFTKELESALLEGAIDFAIHSLKDLPTEPDDRFEFAAVPARADARDVLITRQATLLKDMRSAPVIATGSPRRAAQLRLLKPNFVLQEIRGNIDTRLRKFRDSPGWDALVLAQAGLDRLQPDLTGLHLAPFPPEEMLPAPGQGALAIQIRRGNARARDLAAPLHDLRTHTQITAERAFLQGIGGGCLAPVAAFAEITQDRLVLHGFFLSSFNAKPVRDRETGPVDRASEIGCALALRFLGP
jgi:hydroxymethylbilane synthase